MSTTALQVHATPGPPQSFTAKTPSVVVVIVRPPVVPPPVITPGTPTAQIIATGNPTGLTIPHISMPVIDPKTALMSEAWFNYFAQKEAMSSLSGTYTPDLTNIANLSDSTAYEIQYSRVGDIVTVSGRVDVDPIAGATLTQLGITLPIASDLLSEEQCSGIAFSPTIAGQGAAIIGDIANDQAIMTWISGDITNQPMIFTFSYVVL